MTEDASFVHQSDLPQAGWSWVRARAATIFRSPAGRRLVRDETERIRAKTEAWYAVSPEDRLSEQEVTEWSSHPWDLFEKDLPGRKELFRGRPVEETFQGQTMPLLRAVVERDPSVKRVVEIGVYYGHVCAVLAQEFPALAVLGVDFPTLLARINADLVYPNLTFQSGYALELIEQEKVVGDLFFTCSTATRFKNRELKRYLRAIRKHGRYLVINEPLLPRPGDELVDPGTLSTAESLPVVYSGSSPEMPPCFIHNYKAISEAAGYSVLHYRIYIPRFTVFPNYRIEMVAKCEPE